eukprot:3526872-Prorocentrum_lima.AAC.1
MESIRWQADPAKKIRTPTFHDLADAASQDAFYNKKGKREKAKEKVAQEANTRTQLAQMVQ